MPFPLAFRSPHQPADELYPAASLPGSGLPVHLDAADGTVRDLSARSLTVRVQRDAHVRDAVAVRRGGIDVLVTDARVVMTGARAATGGLLAGHVRLEWLVAVGGSVGGAFRGNDLRLVLQMDSGDYHVVTAAFDRDVDVHELAQDIARRTAVRQLQLGVDGVHERAWRGLTGVAQQDAERGEFGLHWMPWYTPVTALPAGDHLGVPA